MLVRFQPGLPFELKSRILAVFLVRSVNNSASPEETTNLRDFILEYIVAPVAQWIRASVFGTEGRGFESLRVYHKKEVLALRFFVGAPEYLLSIGF